MANIVNTLFPTHPVRPAREFRYLGPINPFSQEEPSSAVQSLHNKEAPCPDGITAEVLKLIVEVNPRILLDTNNACLSEGIFYSAWKVAQLLLIPKSLGNPGAPSSYRPLCMLDTAGKVLEKMLRKRLTESILAAGDLSLLSSTVSERGI